MISRRTSSVSKEDVVFLRLLYCDSRCSQTCRRCSQVCRRCSQVFPGAPRLVVGAPSYSESRQECPCSVWYSPEIDASKFTLHILSGTPGGFQWLKYILLMFSSYPKSQPLALLGNSAPNQIFSKALLPRIGRLNFPVVEPPLGPLLEWWCAGVQVPQYLVVDIL